MYSNCFRKCFDKTKRTGNGMRTCSDPCCPAYFWQMTNHLRSMVFGIFGKIGSCMDNSCWNPQLDISNNSQRSALYSSQVSVFLCVEKRIVSKNRKAQNQENTEIRVHVKLRNLHDVVTSHTICTQISFQLIRIEWRICSIFALSFCISSNGY